MPARPSAAAIPCPTPRLAPVTNAIPGSGIAVYPATIPEIKKPVTSTGFSHCSARARHPQPELRNQLALNLVGATAEGQRHAGTHVILQLTHQKGRCTALTDQAIGAHHLAELTQDIHHCLGA